MGPVGAGSSCGSEGSAPILGLANVSPHWDQAAKKEAIDEDHCLGGKHLSRTAQ